MHLYSGASTEFIKEATQNTIAARLEEAFRAYYRRRPSTGEVRSWQNSLLRMSTAIDQGGLLDHGIVLEYELPLSSLRLDCMVTGVGRDGSKAAVVVELKQWDSVQPSETDDCVRTFVGKGIGDQLHPSRQVQQYTEYLTSFHTVFAKREVALLGCAYLHNMPGHPSSEIFAPKFEGLLKQHPSFVREQQQQLIEFLSIHVGGGGGLPVMGEVLASKIRPSQKLMQNVAAMVRGQSEYVLLDTQLIAYNAILSAVDQAAQRQRKKTVFIIKGGPGTGKSVVALQLLGELSRRGYGTLHATGSRAFTSNLRKLASRGASDAFKYFNDFGSVPANTIDCLVLDEAHRIRASSASRWTRAADRSNKPQAQELIEASKVTVCFIDDRQVVRPNEVGSCQLIEQMADACGANVREFELEAQFRCGGSDGFVSWVDNTLGVRDTANVMWNANDNFEFKIVNSAEELETAIRARVAEGHSARLTAGFCWPWSEPNEDGTLVDDVVVGNWTRPWNARPETKRRLAQNVPKSHFWATNPHGIDQVGCVYTAQGFEFDYVGVIVGADFRRDPDANCWVADKKQSKDTGIKRGTSDEEFLELVRNVYRVLLTRGMKGCYVYFMDDATRRFVLSRTEQ